MENENMPQNSDLPILQNLQPKAKRKKIFPIILTIGLSLLGVYILYTIFYIYLVPNKRIQQIYLVPNDAVIIIQSSEPVADWKKFSRSEEWNTLKKATFFNEIAADAEYLDSLIHENKTLLSLLGKRDMIISLHKTRSNDWDFLILIDMQKASKLDLLKEQIEQILTLTGGTVTQRKYKEEVVIEMRDPDTRDILYMTFLDNHFVTSYTSRLVEAAIDEREKPQIGLNDSFIRSDKLVGNKGLYRIYINYAFLPPFLSLYIDKNEYINAFSGSMDFAGLWFDIFSKKMKFKGYTLMKENANPYVATLINSEHQKMRAHEILSGRTAFYANFSLNNPSKFVKDLEKALSDSDPASYDSYLSTRNKLERYFNISMEQHFLSWMSGEFAVTQSEPGLLGYEPEYILAVRSNNIKDARSKMDYLEQSIKKRSPVKIKSVHYKGYEINYIEIKGFFRLFFGNLFDRFEKPYYTFVEDYVVFSNRSSSLLSFIEDYEQKNLLSQQPGFKKTIADVNASSTLFAYIDIPRFYTQLQSMLHENLWKEITKSRTVLYSFPQWVFQMTNGKQEAEMQFIMNFEPYLPDSTSVMPIENIEKDDTGEDNIAETEKELMNELKRFYVERFEGNILREFYPDGSLKSESETKEGKRNGRYREYYENGALRVRGKYINNARKGMWKYYTEEGKFDKKVKF